MTLPTKNILYNLANRSSYIQNSKIRCVAAKEQHSTLGQTLYNWHLSPDQY
ncbi:MAG: hypothetical protein VKL42_15980 [Snowella sp.]|nr:hypothetical protein [Snowella sp.]